MATKNYATMADFEAALLRAKQGLGGAIETALRQNISSLVQQIKLRVSTTGIDGNGSPFSIPYSRSHAYKRKTKGKGSLGTQNSYKGFYYQGTMWDNFKVIAFNVSEVRSTATLGFTGSNTFMSNQALNQIHSAVETNKGKTPLAMPNKQEGMELTRLICKSIGDYLNSVL